MSPLYRAALALCACAWACGGSTATAPAVPQAEAPSVEPSPRPDAGDVLLVLNKAEASASFVDPHGGAVLATVPVGEGPHEVAVAPDHSLAVVANYGVSGAPGSTLTVLDVRDRAPVRTIDLGEHTRPHGVAWLPDGDEVLVTAEGSGHLLCVNPRSGAVTCAIPTEQAVSHMVVVTPDGARAFVANIGSGTVTAIDLSSRERLQQIETGAGAEGIDVTPDGRELWVTNRAADTVSVVDVERLEVVAELSSPSFPIRARVTPDGSTVLVSNARSGTLSVFDRATRALRATVEMGLSASDLRERLLDGFGESSVPIGVVLDPAGARAFVAHANADVITVLDLETLEVVGTLRAGREPDGMAYIPGPAGR
jgi:YVTN family beta-propeller protein